jgi:hypothetical protein
MDFIFWDEVEQALSPARCPRLRTLHVDFVTRGALVITEQEVRERLPVLASGGVVNLVVSNSNYDFST